MQPDSACRFGCREFEKASETEPALVLFFLSRELVTACRAAVERIRIVPVRALPVRRARDVLVMAMEMLVRRAECVLETAETMAV